MSEETNLESKVLKKAAKSIGTAAGKIAHVIGVKAEEKAVGKLPKKNKSRLPRRQKKALAKAGSPRRKKGEPHPVL